ncbi:MAG: oligosaccharide flippase family protein [candidate division KSB1 bacterium]|nr:oligosaccharide flippase family protein [candidate division KSB1 bacterium]
MEAFNIKFGKQATAGFLGKLFFYIFGFISTIVFSRNLGPASYGDFALFVTVLNITIIIHTIGLPLSARKFLSYYDDLNYKKNYTIALIKIFLFSFVVTLVILNIVVRYIDLIFNTEIFYHYKNYFLVVLFLLSLKSVLEGISQGIEKNHIYAISEFIFGSLKIVIFLLMIHFAHFAKVSLYHAIFAIIVSSLIAIIIYVQRIIKYFSIKKNKGSQKKNINIYIEIVKYGFVVATTNLLAVIIIQTDKLMIGIFHSSEFVGYYNVGLMLANFTSFLLVAISPIVSTTISNFYSKRQKRKIENFYRYVTKWLILMTLPFSMVLIVFAKEIISNLFGTAFETATDVLIIISISKLFEVLIGPIGFLLVMSGNEKKDMAINSIAIIINIVLNYWLIPQYFLIGAAIATSVSWILIALAKIAIMVKAKQYNILNIQDKLKVLSISIIMLIAIFLLKKIIFDIHIVVKIALISLVAYSISFFTIFIFMDNNEKMLLKNIGKNLITINRIALKQK